MPRILIIDEEEDFLITLKLLLQRNGFEVFTLSAPPQISNVELINPDVVILDIKLYRFDGKEACRQLKANEKTARAKIFFCSAHYSNKNRYREFGADDFIEKPFELAGLLQRIHSHLAV